MSGSDQHQFKDRYMLRLPDGMRDRIKAAAEASNRSMNAEIVAALEEKYPEPSIDEILGRRTIRALAQAPRELRYKFAKRLDDLLDEIEESVIVYDDSAYGGDGTGDGHGDGDGAYGDSDGNGDGMGGRS